MCMHKREPCESLIMFLVERTLAGMTEATLAEAHRLLREAARRVSSKGEPVRHLLCFYMPEEDRCICLFAGRDLATVRRVNEIAQVPVVRISLAIDFWTHDGAEENRASDTPEGELLS
jgi:hypothetical protein